MIIQSFKVQYEVQEFATDEKRKQRTLDAVRNRRKEHL